MYILKNLVAVESRYIHLHGYLSNMTIQKYENIPQGNR